MKRDIFFYDEAAKKGTKKSKESRESLGYFCPGFFPVNKDSIVPAMIYLGAQPYQIHQAVQPPAVEFVLVKTDCYLKDWEDALFVSEEDFHQIHQISQKRSKNKNAADKIHYFMEKFTDKGYLPLSKIASAISFTNLH